MREIRTSGSMSGDGKRSGDPVATAPVLDSTERLPRYELRASRGALTRLIHEASVRERFEALVVA